MDKIDVDVSAHGLVTRTYTDEATGKMYVRKDQDISANIDYATKLRNEEQYSRDGIKKGMWHVAHIPDVVIVELLQVGVDIYKAPLKEIVAGLKKIHKEHLLTTSKRIA